MGVNYCHKKNVLHRDLKPQNLLISKDNIVKIADFGLSKLCFNKNQLAYSICGTPEYIAPKIITGKG